MERADDTAIPAFAESDGRTCVTFDHDFHMHLALAGTGKPSVVLLREESLTGREQAELIQSIRITCEDAIESGAAVSASNGSVRLHRLPLR
jgi:predicted nuclease of predicted toxin-antitoxin system